MKSLPHRETETETETETARLQNTNTIHGVIWHGMTEHAWAWPMGVLYIHIYI